MRRLFTCFLLALPVLCLSAVILYSIPPINERLAWRLDELKADIRYALNPPEQVVFAPAGQPMDFSSDLPTATPSPAPTETPTQPGPTETPVPTPTATLIPTPIPSQAHLTGFTHMYQMFNNCGPANLAMALTFWGWKGDQRDTAKVLKPNQRDRNVMPYEMSDFVQSQANLAALVRVGGDLDKLKAFIAAGFPVIVEKGFEGPSFDGWMGHYEVVNGYDDATQMFTVQDSYDGPDLKVSYEKMLTNWRAFNYTYILIYPPERRQEILDILGLHADPEANYHSALEKVTQELQGASGRDLYFSWFNRGTNLVALHDYQAAAIAFDAAFANYPNIPKEKRPWRMMWYQTGPYFAYYYTNRYQDVIDLANATLSIASEPVLEESFYWRGKARLALGDEEGAIEDFRKSLKLHPGFIPAIEELQALGLEP